jgi:alpha-L-fucosidase
MLLKREAKGTVNEVESGGSNTLRADPWQSEITFTDWFYKKDRHLTHNATTVLEMLINAVSKNGNLLLSVELNSDGTIPGEIKEVVKNVGDWLKINGDAIYGTRPWKVYGDGKSVRGDKDDTYEEEVRNGGDDIVKMKETGEHYNQHTTATPAYAHDEVRFTTKGDEFYIIVINPSKGKFIIPSLGKSSKVNPGILKDLTQLYDGKEIKFKQTNEGLSITISAVNGKSYPIVLKAKLKK